MQTYEPSYEVWTFSDICQLLIFVLKLWQIRGIFSVHLRSVWPHPCFSVFPDLISGRCTDWFWATSPRTWSTSSVRMRGTTSGGWPTSTPHPSPCTRFVLHAPPPQVPPCSSSQHLQTNVMLGHSFGGAVIFLSLQHFIAPACKPKEQGVGNKGT